MKRFAIIPVTLFFCTVIITFSSKSLASTDSIATVVAVRGNVTAIDAKGQSRKLSTKDTLFEEDTINTGKTSRIQLLFRDSTIISLGRQTKMKISEYEWNQKEKSGALKTKVTEGTFRVMGGAITRFTPQNFSTETPTATIGVRGSMYAGTVTPTSLSVLFQAGKGIDITNPAGTVAITKPGFGTFVHSPNQPPVPPVKFSANDLAGINEGLTGDIEEPKEHQQEKEPDSATQKDDTGASPHEDGDQPPADGEAPPPEGTQPENEGDQPPADDNQQTASGEQPPPGDDQPKQEGDQPPIDLDQPPPIADGEQPPPDGNQPPPEGTMATLPDGTAPPGDDQSPPPGGEMPPQPDGQMVLTADGQMMFVPEGTVPPEGSTPPPEGQMFTTADGQMMFVPEGTQPPEGSSPMPDTMAPPPEGQIVATSDGQLMFVPEGMEPPEGSMPPPEGMSPEGQVIIMPEGMAPPPDGGDMMPPPPDGYMPPPPEGGYVLMPEGDLAFMPEGDMLAMTGEPYPGGGDMMPPPPDGGAYPDGTMPPPDATMPPPDDMMYTDGTMPPPDGTMPPPNSGVYPDGTMPPPDGSYDPMLYDPNMPPPPDGYMPPPPDGSFTYDPMFYDPSLVYDPMFIPPDATDFFNPATDLPQTIASGDPNVVPTWMPSDGIDGYVGNLLLTATNENQALAMEVNWYAAKGYGVVFASNGSPVFFFGDVSGTSLTNIKLFGTDGTIAHKATGTGQFKGADHQYFDMNIDGLDFDLTTPGAPVYGPTWNALATTGITPQDPVDLYADKVNPANDWHGYVVAVSENVHDLNKRKVYMNYTDSEFTMTIDRINGTVGGTLHASQLNPAFTGKGSIDVTFGGAGKSGYVLDDNFGAIIDSGTVEDDDSSVSPTVNPINSVGNWISTDDPDKTISEYVSWGYWEISHTEDVTPNIENWHAHIPYTMWLAGEKTPASYVNGMSGPATYTGPARGVMIDSVGVKNLNGGHTNLNFNFDSNTIAGNITFTNTGTAEFGTNPVNLPVTGAVSGTGLFFSGNITGASTSIVNGNFYGNQAQSIGGNFDAEYSTSQEQYIGLFGGSR